MPFNRVTDVKSMVMWLLILKSDGIDDDAGIDENKILKVREVPCYVPGMMLIPVPEAGCILGYVDMAFWATFLYVIGSVFYFVDSFFLWPLVYPQYQDDALNPSNYLNTVAAAVFVVNALVCFVDWWLQFKQLSAMNIDTEKTSGLLVTEIPQKMAVYYFYNNLFFLGAAVIYLIQSFWLEDPNTDLLDCNTGYCGNFWINFWGSMLYLLSSIFSVFEFLESIKMRKMQGLPPLKLFSCVFLDIDWFGWGDILYLATSIVAIMQSFIQTYGDVNDDFIAEFYLAQNWLFLIDSIAYFIGYLIFIYEIRQAMKTGIVDARQMAGINALIGDTMDEMIHEHIRHTNAFHTGALPPNIGTTTSDIHSDNDDHNNNHDYHVRPSLFDTKDGMVTVREIRQKLNEARNIRLRRTNERLSQFNIDVMNDSKDSPVRNNYSNKNNNKYKNSSSNNTTDRNTISSFELAPKASNNNNNNNTAITLPRNNSERSSNDSNHSTNILTNSTSNPIMESSNNSSSRDSRNNNNDNDNDQPQRSVSFSVNSSNGSSNNGGKNKLLKTFLK